MQDKSLTLSLSTTSALRGTITLPGDKSLSHRAALFAAMAEGQSTIERFLVSGVTHAMLNTLTALGVEWSLDHTTLRITGKGLSGFATPTTPLNCGNSGTTMRMLAGAMAAAGTPCILDGSDGLRKRPMDRITDPLTAMGVPITTTNRCAPLTLTQRPLSTPLKPIDYTLPVASAQIKSCLILAALAGSNTTTIHEPGPSRDHTERMLSSMGADIQTSEPLCIRVAPLQHPLKPLQLSLPGDISSAAFLLVAAAIVPNSDIYIRSVAINPTRTGILDALSAMGAQIGIHNQHTIAGEPVGDISLKSAPLKGIRISGDTVVRMIDEFPALAVAACAATGTTEVFDAEELRYKESDRISVLCGELKNLGVDVTERLDGFTIQGQTLKGGNCQAHGDHRLAMSLALTGLIAPTPVTVAEAQILSESFPDFVPQLTALGAIAES